MGVGFFKHFKPKKTEENVQGKNDNIIIPAEKQTLNNIVIPAEKKTLTLSEVCEGHEGPEKYTILFYGQKPSLEQIQAANKKWFSDNDDKCEVSENFDVTTMRQEKIRFSEPLVTFVMAADKYDRNTSESTVFSQIQFLGEMAEMKEQEKSNEITYDQCCQTYWCSRCICTTNNS